MRDILIHNQRCLAQRGMEAVACCAGMAHHVREVEDFLRVGGEVGEEGRGAGQAGCGIEENFRWNGQIGVGGVADRAQGEERDSGLEAGCGKQGGFHVADVPAVAQGLFFLGCGNNVFGVGDADGFPEAAWQGRPTRGPVDFRAQIPHAQGGVKGAGQSRGHHHGRNRPVSQPLAKNAGTRPTRPPQHPYGHAAGPCGKARGLERKGKDNQGFEAGASSMDSRGSGASVAISGISPPVNNSARRRNSPYAPGGRAINKRS